MIRAADFRELVRTLLEEYAGAEELNEPDAGRVFSSIIGMMEEMRLLEDEMFFDLIQVYLTVQDVHKVRFSAMSGKQSMACSRGFTARGLGEELYVDSVSREERVSPGERILTINGETPDRYRAKLSQRTAAAPISERDRWTPFLNYADHIEVLRENGTKEKLRLRRFPAGEEQTCGELKQLADGVLYARIDLVNEEAETEAFMSAFREKAGEAKTVVLDLRHQKGEGLTGYRAFVETVIPEAMTAEQFWGKKKLLTRYSETNTDRLTEALQRMKEELPGAGPELRAYIDNMVSELREKRGMGLIADPEEELEEEAYLPGPRAEKIWLLIDAETSDDAEWFAASAARFTNVTLIGRETSGDYHYDYPVVLRFFRGVELSYPIAKTAEVQEAGACHGVQPQVNIPWTREELVRDVMLEHVLQS